MDARGVGQAQALQDNVLGYNARSQLTDITSSVPGADYRIHYDYDAFGNRKKVTTGFTNDIGDKKAIEVNYEYDAMDRMTKVSGNVNTTYHAPVYTSTYLPKEKPGMTYEDIAPDVIVTWTSFDNKPIEAHTITYDWAGNRAIDNGETYGYDALGRLSTISTSAGQTGYRYYDSASRVIESRDGADVQLNDYDAGGRLVVQRMQGQSDRVQRSLVKYNYHNELGYLASYTAQGASGAKLQTATNTVDVLRDTRLTSLTKVQNDGETAYKTSEMQYNLAGAMTAVTARNYKDGVATVDNANSRSMIGDYAGHVLEKTQNGLRTHTLMADDEMIGYSSAAYESFSSVHEGLSAASNADVGVYVVQAATETLTSIAKSVWGDERLWYLIADANGLTMANGTLTVGQSLKIPAKAGATYNGAGTFKPYDAGAIVGSTTPEMALPVPQQSRGGCGGLGQLVMVVVAVVATIYTAGAAAGMLGASGGAWSAGLAVMQGAATGTIGTMGTVAAGAIGGAAGSIASQAVGMAIGAQDSFNWKGVALSAVGGGVSAGVASASAGTALGAKDIAGAIGRAALSNTISQGVGIVTGLQNGFSWRSVAASAAGAAAGYRSAQALQDFDMQDLFKQTATGMAAGATTAIARGGKFDIVRVATDAFGNALGNSLAYQGSSSREQKFAAMDKQVDEAMANGLGDGERLVANTLTDTRSRSLLDKLRAEEMARITSGAREEKLTWDSNDGGYIDADGRLHVVVNGVNPPVERPDDLIEAAGGLAIETPLAIASGAAAAVVSPLYGLYTDIASGIFHSGGHPTWRRGGIAARAAHDVQASNGHCSIRTRKSR
ncbi:hypothetical protein ACL58G_24875 [Massilia sp. GER05]|uniref:LysM peptidoglycan-binding domain-containing protein n=1 Tax=Massilia sp. GER05 TaxID=3394605 RepID=UPI003F85CEE9